MNEAYVMMQALYSRGHSRTLMPEVLKAYLARIGSK